MTYCHWPIILIGPDYTPLRGVAKDKMTYQKWELTKGKRPHDYIYIPVFDTLMILWNKKYKRGKTLCSDWLYTLEFRPGWLLEIMKEFPRTF